ncbi:KilA-N domain-containing protein [Candidatus Gracilibacteria bacterium]|nr:KilA-N domain-containing protein [Candidatus Gracilibacteria bacterium]
MKPQLQVLGTDIKFIKFKDDDFISLTDIARYKNPDEPKDVIKNWLRTKNTIEFLGLWEIINNPEFKGVEFDSFKAEAGGNAFTMSPQKWIDKTNAIGIISKPGNNGGTFAHKDIAIKFASWVSSEFELYLIKEFQRLKQEELKTLDWSAKRFLTKVNYKIHTDAIKENLIPKELSKNDINFVYADEADILNKALFGMTAREWREQNPGKKGNIRDEATIEQLIILANIESVNAEFIKMGVKQAERLETLNKVAITQMKSLLSLDIPKKLPNNLKGS